LSFGEYLFGIFASSFYLIVFIRGGQSITLPTGATFGVDILITIKSEDITISSQKITKKRIIFLVIRKMYHTLKLRTIILLNPTF
jgi:hypothetical protein